MDDKLKKQIDEIFVSISNCLIDDIEKITGVGLCDEEKENLRKAIKAQFILTTLLIKALT